MNEPTLLVFLFAGFGLSLLGGLVLLLPGLKNMPYRKLLMLGALMPMLSLTLTCRCGYMASGKYCVPLLPFMLSYLALVLSGVKLLQARMRLGLVCLFIQTLFINWSFAVSCFSLNRCFMGACC